MNQEMLTVIGTVISLCLALNAYFIKGLIDSITKVQLQVAILIEKTGAVENRLLNCEKGEMLMREALHQMRNELGNRVVLLELKVEERIRNTN